MTARFCRSNHELILGETAYSVARWTGREVFLPEGGGLLTACDAGMLHAVPCKYGGVEEHQRLEGFPGVGGTRNVGTTEDGRILWQHRVFELRCRECNRERVAAHRKAKRDRALDEWAASVIGSRAATNYGNTRNVIGDMN